MVIPAICAHGKALQPLGKGCSIGSPRSPQEDPHLRKWVRILRVAGQKSYLPFLHYNCPHNQIIALRNRVLADVPEPSRAGLTSLRRTVRAMLKCLPKTTRMDALAVAAMYTGAKRARFQRAAVWLFDRGVSRKDARVKLFTKAEKLKSKPDKPNPDPRAIQYRRDVYNLEIGRAHV